MQIYDTDKGQRTALVCDTCADKHRVIDGCRLAIEEGAYAHIDWVWALPSANQHFTAAEYFKWDGHCDVCLELPSPEEG